LEDCQPLAYRREREEEREVERGRECFSQDGDVSNANLHEKDWLPNYSFPPTGPMGEKKRGGRRGRGGEGRTCVGEIDSIDREGILLCPSVYSIGLSFATNPLYQTVKKSV